MKLRHDAHLPAAWLVGLLLAATPSLAADEPVSEEAPEPAKLDFAALDKDKDGGLSAAEIPAGHPLADDFPDVDGNGDGKLDRDEFDAYNQ